MVATRRGGRVSPQTKADPEGAPEVQATPARRTRAAAKQAVLSGAPQDPLLETFKQLEAGGPSSPSSAVKRRCSRASRLHSPEQPCTPAGSVHEGDASDAESRCSVTSDAELQLTRSRSRKTRRRPLFLEDEASEAESCSSAVSASKPRQSSRGAARGRRLPAEVREDAVLEAESCSSPLSQSQRVTRSQRKTARGQAPPTRPSEDSELSDADSCASVVSGADASQSVARRSTRSRRHVCPVPIHLDESAESSQSPEPATPRTRPRRGKAAAAADVSEPPSCDSEGFESGPARSVAARRSLRTRKAAVKVIDSDSEAMDAQSSAGSRGTPCSSRAGSGNSSRSAPSTRSSMRDVSVVLERAVEAAAVEAAAVEAAEEEDGSMNDSRLETTVVEEDAERTLLEEEENQVSGGAKATEVTPSEADTRTAEVIVLSDDDEPAVISADQQEEPPAADKAQDASEMDVMQETVPSAEPAEPSPAVTEAPCAAASQATGGAEDQQEDADQADVEAHPAQAPQPDSEAAADTDTRPRVEEEMERPCVEEEEMERPCVEEEEEMERPCVEEEEEMERPCVEEEEMERPCVEEEMEERPCVEEEMEVSAPTGGAQQVVDVQETAGGRPEAPAQPESEQQLQRTQRISLLDSSEEEEDDDDDDDDDDDEEEESEVCGEEERARPSKSLDAAAMSVDGLFMIDTRPGHDTSDHYYKTDAQEDGAATSGRVEQERAEDSEEFVDEEADDDDDDDANVLFSSRDPHLKSLSSRIDAGIRVKELGGLYISFDGSRAKPASGSLHKLKEKKLQDEVMKKSVIGPDFEKKEAVPPYSESKQALKLKRKAEREKSTGGGWFDMKAPEVTQELKGDLQVLKMRSALDPKRFYKKNDRDGFPKYFQVGTVVDSPVDFYHSRIPKKERKRTMVEELLADADFRQKNKRKFQQVIAEQAALAAGKRHRKKKKFQRK